MDENAYEAPQTRRWFRFSLRRLLVAIGVIGALMGAALAVKQSVEAERRLRENWQQLAIGLTHDEVRQLIGNWDFKGGTDIDYICAYALSDGQWLWVHFDDHRVDRFMISNVGPPD
jgi:hypothetical protein